MRVRVNYTVDVDDEFRRALAQRTGTDGLATREQVRHWYERNGQGADDIVFAEDPEDADRE